MQANSVVKLVNKANEIPFTRRSAAVRRAIMDVSVPRRLIRRSQENHLPRACHHASALIRHNTIYVDTETDCRGLAAAHPCVNFSNAENGASIKKFCWLFSTALCSAQAQRTIPAGICKVIRESEAAQQDSWFKPECGDVHPRASVSDGGTN
eukprot:1394229-Pleurochrysis_carterae.AAC.2